MSDKIECFYEKYGKGIKKPKDKTITQHHILPISMILCIGPTGSGKSNFLMNLLKRQNGKYFEIIIFTASTTDEFLYNVLKQAIPEIKFYDNINDMPDLLMLDNDETNKNEEKLVVWDDFINLNSKEKVKICKWVNSSRKFGFTNLLMSQNYTDVPTQIRRNINYFIIFKLNDIGTLKHILRMNAFGVDKDKILKAYQEAVSHPKNFFMIDCKTTNPIMHFRSCFLNFLDLS